MKKLLLFVLMISCISFFLIKGKTYKKGNKQLILANIEALAQTESGALTSSVICYNTYSSCWFWNCEHIWRCSANECYDVKCDSKESIGTCYKIAD